MIGAEEIQRYRDMSVEEKLREFCELMDVAFEVLDSLPLEERKRRWNQWAAADEKAAEELAALLIGPRP